MANNYLTYAELRRWLAILSKARTDYREDGNTARRFFETELDDLLIDIGQYLPPSERRPNELPTGSPNRATAEKSRLRGNGDEGGTPVPA